ncbi:MAG: fumarylacetoacetate hydrolase family protein [Steroidobacteraceae bacterium]
MARDEEALDVDRLAAVSDLLYGLWTEGRRIAELPPSLRPRTRVEGYRIQGLLERRSAKPLFGWKIAATSVAGQNHIRVDGPLAGRILAERVINDGGECPLSGNLMRVAELEFAFRMSADLPPQSQPYTINEVMERVATLHPAIEIPDSRLERFDRVGAAQLIADNACAHYFLLGPASPPAWRSLNLAEYEIWGSIGGEAPRAGLGSNVLGDPRVALVWLVNELSLQGLTLRAGEVVTTGTCIKPLEIGQGDRLTGDFGSLGRVSITLT